jgi:phage terminase small subunit
MAQRKKQNKLTDFEDHFCLQYVIDFNGARAARDAGSTAERPDQAAYELLRRPEVRKRIEELITARRERLFLSQDRPVIEAALLAFSDLRDVASWDENGVQLIPSHKLEPHLSRMIKSVKHVRKVGATTENTVEIVLHDKIKALELLGRHLGMFRDEDPEKGKAQTVNLVMPSIPDPDANPDGAQAGMLPVPDSSDLDNAGTDDLGDDPDTLE